MCICLVCVVVLCVYVCVCTYVCVCSVCMYSGCVYVCTCVGCVCQKIPDRVLIDVPWGRTLSSIVYYDREQWFKEVLSLRGERRGSDRPHAVPRKDVEGLGVQSGWEDNEFCESVYKTRRCRAFKGCQS